MDGQFVVLVFLKVSDRLTEQASTDEEDQVGHDDEEDSQSYLQESAVTIGSANRKKDSLERLAKA